MRSLPNVSEITETWSRSYRFDYLWDIGGTDTNGSDVSQARSYANKGSLGRDWQSLCIHLSSAFESPQNRSAE